jgi:hypothetical protein
MKDLSPNKNFAQRQETVGGIRYTVVPLQELLLIPQKSGSLEIPAYGMDLTVGVPANLDRFNVNVGLHWMLYEKSYRENAKAKRMKKKEKRAEKRKSKK